VFSGVSAFNPVDLGPVNTATGASTWSSTVDTLATGGFTGFNVQSGVGNFFQQGAPVFGPPPPPPPPPTPQQVRQVVEQMAQSPDVHIVAP
jgi:hypothetical protein